MRSATDAEVRRWRVRFWAVLCLELSALAVALCAALALLHGLWALALAAFAATLCIGRRALQPVC